MLGGRAAGRAFWRDRRGGIAVILAVVLPALLMLICAAIDLSSLNGERSQMQDAADATALAMAKQLGVATAAGITARATDYADAQLGPVATKDNVQVATTIASDNSSVTVTLTGKRASFFGNLLPPGGWTLNTQATAMTMGELPLCVLSYGVAGGSNLHVANQSHMTATGCLVQSNGNINVDNGAQLQAGMAQAVGDAKGPITPSPQSGAPSIADPFASLDVSIPQNTCSPYNVTFATTGWLPSGSGNVHCGNIGVQDGVTLQLAPGEHYFAQGQLQLQGNATLTGSDVVLIFDKHSHFSFTQQSTVDLSGRTSGPFAGFVIATTRQNTGAFNISSTSAEKIEGAIYIPSATLKVQGVANKVAEQSAWTVVVAQSIQVSGSANLVINANYATSGVPAPGGVGSHTVSTAVALKK
jgi:Flp pilus assembly protein TadG